VSNCCSPAGADAVQGRHRLPAGRMRRGEGEEISMRFPDRAVENARAAEWQAVVAMAGQAQERNAGGGCKIEIGLLRMQK